MLQLSFQKNCLLKNDENRNSFNITTPKPQHVNFVYPLKPSFPYDQKVSIDSFNDPTFYLHCPFLVSS